MAKTPKKQKQQKQKQRVPPAEPSDPLTAAKRGRRLPALATALHVKRAGKQVGPKKRLGKTSRKLRLLAAEPSGAFPPVSSQNQPPQLATAIVAESAGKRGANPPKKRKQRAPRSKLALPSNPAISAVHEDRLARLDGAIHAVRSGERVSPRVARLLAAGVPKMAQKVVEEAAEVAIDAVRGERTAFVNESADLLYNLVVLWSALGVTPAEIWAEMDRREAMLGMAEKLPKADETAE